MVAELKTEIKYHETFIPGQREPILVLRNLLEAGIFANYVMYEGNNEVRIAGNELVRVSVSQDSVVINGLGKFHSEPVSDPLKQVETLLKSLNIKNWTAYGYIAFDIARFYSAYSKAISQELLYFLIPETELRFTETGVHIKTTKSLDQIEELLFVETFLPDYDLTSLVIDFSDNENYKNRVDTLITAIQNGDLQKAIISRSVKVTGNLDILGTYVVGSKANNSARSYCLNLEDIRAVGFSPEILMQVNENGFVVTNPLAATRPRGADSEEDIRLSGELFTDAKEVKEHSLSAWLAQNEITSLCLPETVRVFDFMEVKKYRCVQHLSSRVGGQLLPKNTLWDALKVLFPGITVSGIDKKQALEWINNLEDEPRGIYAGGIGWVDSNGAADIAIAIRSVYQYGNKIHLNAGAGIVAESIPEKEYIESVNKMNTMLNNLVLEA
ncbi:salicylate synthase [Anabaena cylindrica FACHB-243]|uniref:Anthranilate synthase n=1 Tax=Anabaena cylindrica (strain ATCC 27899 / PCC 7122) TaxID=272123 RepID=K9ZR02_ANACC|nr:MULTISPECIES: salicylate synthase [Anabaena]AFZ60780.1 Anthranilate synthase [Anabaena cylindrica PCC 7122]MBD2417079.1 salicylate synthase [Anabaena cylindrica FACHB-243]MBY5280775.1 salicylate synthase [Anabaena sp. CCAP 1446/1C]MBY5307051.1 salicylate synthase [Anabaena sp. CCAP 1446/1C]MCM2406779.1 salicylate synthase [Anabaena sp. CCAP 1446/1C]